MTIAVPTYKNIPSQFFFNFLTAYEESKKKFSVNVLNVDSTMIEAARNILVDRFLRRKSDFLFFVDSDMLLPVNIIENLIQHDKDVVSGIYFGRSQMGETHVMASVEVDGEYKPINSFPAGLIEVDAVGLGCCMLKKEVVEKVSDSEYDKPLFLNKFISRDKMVGEDFYFCELLRKNGFNIFVDPAIQCGHIGGVIDTKYYLANRK